MTKQLLFLFTTLILWAGTALAQKPEVSYPGHQVWYQVVSAFPETKGMVMSDCSAASASFPVGIESPQEALASQQWLLVYADDAQKLVYLVNRNTGHTLQPISAVEELYRVTQLLRSANEGKGFVLTGLGRGQYAFVGIENDGQSRGLVAIQQGQAMGNVALEQNTPYAWTFKKMQVTNGVEEASADEKPLIYFRNRHIEVSGGIPYTITRADGVQVPCDSQLPAGVYMVTAAGQTTKVVNGKQ